ncbi:hypothetical protein FACS1894123_01890 [Bacteroidia bacterium]|nr:hypothetical protein FACS1894123_01890 [Bacteroidia bacterium]
MRETDCDMRGVLSGMQKAYQKRLASHSVLHILLMTFCILFASLPIFAQEPTKPEGDTIRVSEVMSTFAESSEVDSFKSLLKRDTTFVPEPNKAVLYAIVPGLGQIYNRKYWKLPLVYGSYLGCVYAITWNGNQYSGYKRAYIDFIDDDPNTTSWNSYHPYSFPDDVAEWTSSQKKYFESSLKSKKDYYRRYRDLSYIITIGVSAIWMIDAYVDAHLFNFDISPDLSMRMGPAFFERTNVNSNAVGMQLSFSF